jgi:hypothetical protein
MGECNPAKNIKILLFLSQNRGNHIVWFYVVVDPFYLFHLIMLAYLIVLYIYWVLDVFYCVQTKKQYIINVECCNIVMVKEA